MYCITEYFNFETIGDQDFWDTKFDSIEEAEIVAEHVYNQSPYCDDEMYYVMIEEYDKYFDEFVPTCIYNGKWLYDEDVEEFLDMMRS